MRIWSYSFLLNRPRLDRFISTENLKLLSQCILSFHVSVKNMGNVGLTMREWRGIFWNIKSLLSILNNVCVLGLRMRNSQHYAVSGRGKKHLHWVKLFLNIFWWLPRLVNHHHWKQHYLSLLLGHCCSSRVPVATNVLIWCKNVGCESSGCHNFMKCLTKRSLADLVIKLCLLQY